MQASDADVMKGYPTDKVPKVIIKREISQDDLELVKGILLYKQELKADDMAEVLTKVPGVTLEAAMILTSSWFDGGKNKKEWKDADLKNWIQHTLIIKTKKDDIMNNFGVELVKVAKEVMGKKSRIATTVYPFWVKVSCRGEEDI